jgi:protein-L-isoaspartate(D-aspartate) O-methyltransferase
MKPGGILIAPLSTPGAFERISQHLVKIIRTEEGPARETLIAVAFVPMLPGLPQEARTADEEKKH